MKTISISAIPILLLSFAFYHGTSTAKMNESQSVMVKATFTHDHDYNETLAFDWRFLQHDPADENTLRATFSIKFDNEKAKRPFRHNLIELALNDSDIKAALIGENTLRFRLPSPEYVFTHTVNLYGDREFLSKISAKREIAVKVESFLLK